MSYLICEKCGGYYELQEGESIEDFDSCQCGGKLGYDRKKDDHITNLNDTKNFEYEKQRQTKVLGIYDDIKREKTRNYFKKRDIKMESYNSENLVSNSAFILLTFTIFPLTFAVEYNFIPFIILAVFSILLPGLFYYLQTSKKINTIAEIKKIYGICGLYFASFLGIFLIWVLMNLFGFVVNFLNNFPTIAFAFVFALIFIQKYIGNYMGLEISDPLTSLSDIKKYIYYIGVFISTVWFIFVFVIAVALHLY